MKLLVNHLLVSTVTKTMKTVEVQSERVFKGIPIFGEGFMADIRFKLL